MGADQALDRDRRARADSGFPESQARSSVEAARFEPFGLKWRDLSTKERIKKAIFVFSLAAAIGYYLFLGALIVIG